MSFIDDDGNELIFDGAFAMTKQAVSFFNGAIKGDVSITFAIDNNSINRRILGYNGPQMLNQVAFTKQAFNRVRNGNILDRGFLVIQDETTDNLSCFYVSGNSNWIQFFQTPITQLDYYGVRSAKNYAALWDAATVLSRAAVTDGIVYPMVDWGYNLNKGNSDFLMIAKTDFIQRIADFYPCFYLHSLCSEIANQAGFKFTGTLFSEELYKSIALSPVDADMRRSDYYRINNYGATETIAVAPTKYTAFTSNDKAGHFSSGRYTANIDVLLFIRVDDLIGNGDTQTYLYKNGVQLYTFIDIGAIPGFDEIYFSQWVGISLLRGDYLEIYTDVIGNVRYNWFLEVMEEIWINDYVTPAHFLPKLTGLDIVKFLSNYFGCVVTYDEFSKTITVNVIERFKTEDASDWSSYYVSHRSEYTVKQGQNNYLRLSDNKTDPKIVAYNRVNEVNFGEGNIETGNTLKAKNQVSKIPFAASISGTSKNTSYVANIPLVNLKDDKAFTFTGITDLGGGRIRLDGISPTSYFEYGIIRIANSIEDLGYFFTDGGTSTINVFMDFTSSFSGTFWTQRVDYNSITPRLLTIRPSSSITSFSSGLSSFGISTSNSIGTSSDFPIPYATFSKEFTSLPIDQWKNNLSIDNPQGSYLDPTIKELYFNKISRFLQNPTIRAIMIIPEAVYHSWTFDRFIYLNTEKLTGYFFVDSIVNYVDASTPVEVNLYML